MDIVSYAAPILDLAALMFGAVPIVGQVLIVAALTANAISAINSAIDATNEISQNGFTWRAALDVVNVAASAAGFSVLGAVKWAERGAEVAAGAIKPAAKAAQKRPWSGKARDGYAGAIGAYASAEGVVQGLLTTEYFIGVADHILTPMGSW